jgi:hypothetical protein
VAGNKLRGFMKIGVFGDSFCDTFDMRDKIDYKEYHWAHILSKSLGATTVDFYAEAGSSFYYTYQNILKLAPQYDKVICCVSSPYRYPVKICPPISDNGCWVPGVENIPKVFDESMKQNIKGWYLISDLPYLENVQEAFISNLENKFSNIMIIPCFTNSFTNERQARGSFFAAYKWSLYQAVFRNHIKVNFNTSWEVLGPTNMLCHIPTEWHPHVAETIYNHIKYGSDLKVECFPLSTTDPKNYFIY